MASSASRHEETTYSRGAPGLDGREEEGADQDDPEDAALVRFRNVHAQIERIHHVAAMVQVGGAVECRQTHQDADNGKQAETSKGETAYRRPRGVMLQTVNLSCNHQCPPLGWLYVKVAVPAQRALTGTSRIQCRERRQSVDERSAFTITGCLPFQSPQADWSVANSLMK